MASRRPRLARRRRLARGRDRAPKSTGRSRWRARARFPRTTRASPVSRQSTARLASVDRARSRRRPRAVVARRPGAIAIPRAMISPEPPRRRRRRDRSRHRARHGPRRDRAETRVHAARGRVLAGGGGGGRKSDIKRLPAHTLRHDAIVRAKFAETGQAVEFHRRERAEVRSGIPIRHDLIGEEKHFRTKRTNKTGKGKTKWLACLLLGAHTAPRIVRFRASARPGASRPTMVRLTEMALRPGTPFPALRRDTRPAHRASTRSFRPPSLVRRGSGHHGEPDRASR